MISNKTLKQQYSYFYKKVFRKELSFSAKNDKEIGNFLKILSEQYGESVGEEWLFDYLSFQFNKFGSADTNMKLQLNWIYGKKGLKNYKDRHDEADYFAKAFTHDCNIKKGHVLSNNKTTLSTDYKNHEKVRFRDPYRKLLHCSELELYEEKSAICMFCEVKNKCYAKRKV